MIWPGAACAACACRAPRAAAAGRSCARAFVAGRRAAQRPVTRWHSRAAGRGRAPRDSDPRNRPRPLRTARGAGRTVLHVLGDSAVHQT
eukprot:scaffold447_cov384-Prasinococcus_capsulatus_cf.AAC.1